MKSDFPGSLPLENCLRFEAGKLSLQFPLMSVSSPPRQCLSGLCERDGPFDLGMEEQSLGYRFTNN